MEAQKHTMKKDIPFVVSVNVCELLIRLCSQRFERMSSYQSKFIPAVTEQVRFNQTLDFLHHLKI